MKEDSKMKTIETTATVGTQTFRVKVAVRRGRAQKFQQNGSLWLVTLPTQKAARAYLSALAS